MIIQKPYEYRNFNKNIDKKTNFKTQSILCLPIIDPSTKELLGVTQLLNKKCETTGEPVEFTGGENIFLYGVALSLLTALKFINFKSVAYEM